MSKPWCYLLYRYGNETGAPTRDDIAAAAKELYDESVPGMHENSYEEHGAASLRYGYDEGPMYVLEISRYGTACWEEWADQDYITELCPMKEIKSLPQEKAVLFWEQLAEGKIELVRVHFSNNLTPE